MSKFGRWRSERGGSTAAHHNRSRRQIHLFRLLAAFSIFAASLIGGSTRKILTSRGIVPYSESDVLCLKQTVSGNLDLKTLKKG